MYKEKLFEIVEYNVDKITFGQYVKMLCKLDEMEESDCKTFFNEQGDLTPTRKSVHSAIGAVASLGTGGTSYLAYRGIKAVFSKCARACGVFGWNSEERQKCLAKCKAQLAAAKAKGEEHDVGSTKVF